MSNIKIKITDLHKNFSGKNVLNGVNLEIKPQESFVVIGGSGCGKSVLIKSILGLIPPSKGSILIDGQETTKLSGSQRSKLMYKFGMLFQGGALFDSLKVWENVVFAPMQLRSMSKMEAKKLAISKLNDVGLGSEVGSLYPSELSGGMQKRVALARAIAANPEIIFFDEPTTGLDPIMSDVINDLIVKCSKKVGATTISITHDLASARKIGDKIGMLYQGKFIWIGNIEDLDNSGNPYVQQFIEGSAEGPIKMQINDH